VVGIIEPGSSSVHEALLHGRKLEANALVSQHLLKLSVGDCVVYSLDTLHHGLGVVSWTFVTHLMILSALPGMLNHLILSVITRLCGVMI
jgi:hypothetical protein